MSEQPVQARPVLAIAATFTVEPIEEALSFWLSELDLAHDIRFAPYNQVFQAILPPSGLLAANAGGLNAVLIRPDDWKRARQTAAPELAAAFHNSGSSSEWIVVFCPGSPEYSEFASEMEAALRGVPSVHCANAGEVLNLYPVDGIFDEAADALGHVPYTPAFFAALGTWIARRIHALRVPPYKAIALDCDNTLWEGICGEDGPMNVTVDAGRDALQRFMLAQRDQGMLLCLCSKNNEGDVFETIRAHPEMALKTEHVAAWRINWEAKSANLPALATELDIGLDSFIFIDDDRRECAEVMADCPRALTLPLPADSAEIPEFLRHVWAFDHARVTEADRMRAEQYARSAERRRAERQAGSLADFIAGLNLQVTIRPLAPLNVARAAQLTARTNQMNFTGVRRSEAELRTLVFGRGSHEYGTHECLTVDVEDRFGGYGMVGVMLFRAGSTALLVDTFLLSCRALGRGVEQRMVAELGRVALARGLDWVELPFRETERNPPARAFIESLDAARDGSSYRLAAGAARKITWKPSAVPAVPVSSPGKQGQGPRRFDDYVRVATELRGVDQILEALRARRSQGSRRAIAVDAAPRGPLETQIARIWSELLGADMVGRDENFFDLGGHSLLAIQLLSRIREASGTELSLDVVYNGPLTVAELARAVELARLGAVPPSEYDAILAEIEALSEEEARALLEAEGGDVSVW